MLGAGGLADLPARHAARTSSGACSTASSSATRARWASSAPSRSSPATSAARPTRCRCTSRSSTTSTTSRPRSPSRRCSPSWRSSRCVAKSAGGVARARRDAGTPHGGARMSIEVRERHQDVRRLRRRERREPRACPSGRAGRAARPVGLGQDEPAAHHRRASSAPTAARSSSRARTPRVRDVRAPRRRLRLPALRALPPHDRVRERRLRPARAAARDAGPPRGGDPRPGSWTC